MTDASSRPPAKFAEARHAHYAVIVAAFVSLLLISNIAATKGIQFGPLILDGGAFLFPLTYVLGDALAEVYGFTATRRAIILGFLASLVASAVFYLVSISPAVPGYDNSEAFSAVLGVVPHILVASMAGYLAGQLLNAASLVAIKRRTSEKMLWARLLGSTLVGEAADTVVFCTIAAPAIGIETFEQFLNYVIVGYVFKTLVEVAVMPITYRVVAWLKRHEPSYPEA